MRSTRTRSKPRIIDLRNGEHCARELDSFEFDWRDPDMPICQPGKDNLTGKVVSLLMSPEEKQLQCQLSFQGNEPSWRNDPTYNMRRRG